MAAKKIRFQGLPARICWVGLGDRHRLGLAFNEMVASGELKVPVVIGRDHLDSGSVASPCGAGSAAAKNTTINARPRVRVSILVFISPRPPVRFVSHAPTKSSTGTLPRRVMDNHGPSIMGRKRREPRVASRCVTGGGVMRKSAVASACGVLLLASCGRPDASGIYVQASDRGVTLVQLVQTREGNITGRLENVVVTANGAVNDQSIPIDGAASKHDLMFKPAGAWNIGLTATGTFSGSGLTLSGTGFELNAQRSDLGKYRTAVAHLQSVAAGERQGIAAAQATQAAQAAEARAIRNDANKTAKIEAATDQLRNDTARMNAAVANCPDFGRRSATNSERIKKMLQLAPTLSDMDRNRLIVAANQVEVGTTQIEVARSQYAIGLNQIVQDAVPIADGFERFCGSPQGAQFAQPCVGAKTAAADYRTAFARDRARFAGYKQAVRDELNHQSAMLQRMRG